MSTFTETVEQLKNQYTDQYVKVDARRPELARFRNVVGQVKTVNMNGRALVQFLDYHQNVGWHDIDLSCLTIVDAPPADAIEKPEPKRGHDKPEGKAAPTAGAKQVADAKATAAAGAKKLSPLEMARMQGAGAKGAAAPAKPAATPAAGGKKSTADVLAAARGGAKPAAAPAAGAKKSTADILAAARGGAAPVKAEPAAAKPATPAAAPAAKPAGGKLSTADILAAARSKAAAPAATPEPIAAEPPAAEPAPSAAAPATPAAAPTAAAAPAGGVVKVDRSSMSVDEMIAYCRSKDAQ